MWVVLLVSGLLVWAGATLLLDAAFTARSRPDLGERLLRFQARSLADETELWLRGLADHLESRRVEQLVHTSVGGFLLSQAS